MKTTRALSLLVGAATLTLALGANATPQGPDGANDDPPCAKDADCPGDQVCVGGKCTLPPSEAKPDTPPPAEPPPAEPKPADPPPKPDTPPPAAPPGCGSDSDCKGDRICENGKCVTPAAKPAPAEKPKPTVATRRYSGKLSGAGSASFRIRGKRISHASARVKGVQFSLRDSGLRGNKTMLSGNRGRDWVKIRIQLKKNGKWASGRYEASINRKRIKGSFSASSR